MDTSSEKAEVKEQVNTLEMEVKKFADELPFWAIYLAEKILSCNVISDFDIDVSYSYLLEELKLKEETEKPQITISYNALNSGNYKIDLLFTKLENVEGVNALNDNQTIEFSPNLTIIYGTNGSGKSGYARLLKKAFCSKAPEDILQNIHIENGHKPVNANFIFRTGNTDISLTYLQKDNTEFEQFAVFDSKCLFKHLAEKNEFEYRPAGLGFFAEFTDAVIRIEQKLNSGISAKKLGNTASDLSDLFDGDSQIKSVVKSLSAKTKIEDLKKFVPFSEVDKSEKVKIQKQYDELFLASKGKEKEINSFRFIKSLLNQSKQAIEKLNQYFSIEALTKVKTLISDYLAKEAISKSEGIENFKTNNIEGIGTEEWKNFIVAAEAFARKQKFKDGAYPEDGDNCLLCQQPLSENAEILISNYWKFIKSIAEENARKSQETLEKVKQAFEKLNFDLFPDDNTLTIWLNDKYSKQLEKLKQKLLEQKSLSKHIISDIQRKILNERNKIDISVDELTIIETSLDVLIKSLSEDDQGKLLEKLLEEKLFLEHKEKFNLHFQKFETYVKNQKWIDIAKRADFAKRKITDTEKALSQKYFNQRYVDTFNEECFKLNGNFGIDINHTGSAGKSYRKLVLKGKDPNKVLSEGEQKIVAIADFLTEMNLSEINKGIIFDDPVTSLDEKRKSEISERFVVEAKQKQVIIFTHDLVFVSFLISYCSDNSVPYLCHWIENREGKPGLIWLNNSPSYEKEYRNSDPVKKHYIEAKKDDCSPMHKEFYLKTGFTALRTCYEVLVINDLFKNVVQRFSERVSIDSLSSVFFDAELIEEIQDSFAKCCSYMEGHTHSDKYAFKKPEVSDLNIEIQRYESIRSKIKKSKKPSP